MKFKVDKDACICCGTCEAICDEVFKISDEGYAIATEEKITDNKIKEKAICALEGCPTDAIHEDEKKEETN